MYNSRLETKKYRVDRVETVCSSEGKKIDKLFFSLCGIFNLTFVSQELRALKEAKHYHFSFHIDIFNAASMWGFLCFFELYEIFIIWVDVLYMITVRTVFHRIPVLEFISF